MWNEADLQLDVEKQLSWELGTVLAHQIGVIAKNGSVELRGPVDSYWQKCAAESAAWRVSHVRSVVNEIRVDIPFHALRSDDDIALAAMGNFEWNCVVPGTVEVKVMDSWVTLHGSVEWQYQKEEAERALRPLFGIKGISNEIAVQPKGSLAEVKVPIEDALKRNVLVDAGHIKVHASHGVIGLRGTARSRAEHDEVMHAAWSAPGVSSVEDHVIIGLVRGE